MMRFLVDENAGPSVARWLRGQGHDVLSIYESARGLSDSEVMRLAVDEKRILITSDKDFGDRVYRERQPHRGVVCFDCAMNECRSNLPSWSAYWQAMLTVFRINLLSLASAACGLYG